MFFMLILLIIVGILFSIDAIFFDNVSKNVDLNKTQIEKKVNPNEYIKKNILKSHE